MHETWVTVQEYEVLTGRKHQSIYRSVKRGTIESKRSDDGVLLVRLPATDATDIQPGATGNDDDLQPDATDPVQPVEGDVQPPTMPLTVTYSQEYVDMMQGQIDALKADKLFLQQALAAALMLPGKSTDVQPDETDDVVVTASNEAAAADGSRDPGDAGDPVAVKVGFMDRLKFLFTGKM